MEDIINTFINGLSLGSVYALIALGYTMVYGIAKMLNFAHGDIIMVGAYIIYELNFKLGLPAIPSVLISIVGCLLFGILMEKVAYKPLRGASPLAVLITAIGVSYLLQSLSQLIFGSARKSYNLAKKLNINGVVHLGNISIRITTIITLAVSILIMIALNTYIKKSKIGRAMVAVSEDKGAAQLMGVNVNSIITITFAIGSALAAVASAFYLMRYPSVYNTLGSMPGIKAFTAAVIGGIGSIPGAMIGGLLLGIVECFVSSTSLSPYVDAVEFGVLIVILLVKPSGILGKVRREKV